MQDFHNSASWHADTDQPEKRFRTALITLILFILSVIPACRQPAEDAVLDQRTLNAVDAILTDVARTETSLSPETATRLGLSAYATPQTNALLDDYSQAAFERARLVRIDLLNRVRSRPSLPERHPLARDLVILSDAIERLTDLQKIGHGRLSPQSAYPYAVDPYSGVWRSGPELLLYDHQITTQEEAEAWLSRLSALTDAYDDTRRRLIADAGAGLVPPQELLETTIIELTAQNTQISVFEDLETTFTNLVSGTTAIEPNDAERLLEAVQHILQNEVIPAHARLKAELESLRPQAPTLLGLQSQPNGFGVWRSLLDWYGTNLSDLSDLHAEHTAESARRRDIFDNTVAALPDEIKAVPRTEWAQRLSAISISDVEVAIDENESAPPPITTGFRLPQRQSRTAEELVLPGQVLAQSLNRRRPTLLILNVEANSKWPNLWRNHLIELYNSNQFLASQNAIVLASQRTPARLIYRHPSFELGWAAYIFSATPNDLELDLVKTWMTAEIYLLIANMAVVDTGIHLERWSLEDAKTLLMAQHPFDESLAEFIALSISARPGEASARLFGQQRFENLEARGRAVLGQRFDQADFETVLLQDGPRPFEMVETDIERWYEGQIDR